MVVWRATPSAARIAYDLVGNKVDQSDLADFMEWVDKLDGGGISRVEYMSDEPAVWLGRVIDVEEGIALKIMEGLIRGDSIEEILSVPSVAQKLSDVVGALRAATARRAVDLALVAWPLTLAPFALYDCRLDAKLLGAVGCAGATLIALLFEDPKEEWE